MDDPLLKEFHEAGLYLANEECTVEVLAPGFYIATQKMKVEVVNPEIKSFSRRELITGKYETNFKPPNTVEIS